MPPVTEARAISPRVRSAVDAARASPGEPLAPALRARLEGGIKADFSGVRVHTGARSARAAEEVAARAFTLGRHIHFAHGAYDPTSERGFELIAHEAAHTLQPADSSALGRLELSEPHDADELEADRIARAVASDAPAVATSVATAVSEGRLKRAPDPLRLEANRVTAELQHAIAGATWKEIRKRVYPAASAAGIARAKERHTGNRADLTGLGKLSSLDRFATSVRGIQSTWTASNPADRVKALGKAADKELSAADVPGFLVLDKQQIEPKAFFSPSTWGFTISEALVTTNALSNDDAAELANATLHESRHAEQQFLAARFAAGINNDDAAAIVRDQLIPQQIADKAVAKKFDATTDPKVAALGRQMYGATVTDGATNQQISDDIALGIADLNAKRGGAQNALTTLTASATAETVSDAKAARDALTAQILVVEQKYALYRNIPYEADAHEVGDAEAVAFKGWPSDKRAPRP